MSVSRRALVLAASAALMVPAAADAAITASVTPADGLKLEVASTESDLHVRTVEDGLLVTELANRPITEGAGCSDAESPFFPGEERALCNLPPLRFVTLVGGTLRDELTLAPGAGDCLCFPGAGNDEIRGANGADLVEAGDGDDVVLGRAGGDVLRGGGGGDDLSGEDGDDILEGQDGDDTLADGTGADRSDGGEGADRLIAPAARDAADTYSGGGTLGDRADYSARGGAVSLRVGFGAVSGAPPTRSQPSEGDTLLLNIEDLAGGAGGDTLVASSPRSNLFGNGGSDTLRGGTPPPGANPTVDDVLDGGLGADLLDGQGGNDRLLARDAVDDQVSSLIVCGSGSDVLDADVRDDDTRALPTDCESVSQGMVGEDPNVHIRSAKRAAGGGLIVTLRCPRKARRGCKGKLALKRGRGFTGGLRYAIRRGRWGKVRLPSGAKRGASVRIRSVERGRLGPRTTFRTLKVKR
jgi:Ca2+-binding RTX toxin-like protein